MIIYLYDYICMTRYIYIYMRMSRTVLCVVGVFQAFSGGFGSFSHHRPSEWISLMSHI